MRRLFVAALALALAACSGAGTDIASTGAAAAQAAASAADAAGATPPAPLANTIADEKAVTIAAGGVDVAAVSLSALAKAGLIRPGSPIALDLANKLDGARNLVNAAAAAREAGDARSYREALAQAETALTAVKAAIVNFGA